MDPVRILKAFRCEVDGSWTCLEAIRIDHPSGRIEVAAGTRIMRGRLFMGVRLAEWLQELAARR